MWLADFITLFLTR